MSCKWRYLDGLGHNRGVGRIAEDVENIMSATAQPALPATLRIPAPGYIKPALRQSIQGLPEGSWSILGVGIAALATGIFFAYILPAR